MKSVLQNVILRVEHFHLWTTIIILQQGMSSEKGSLLHFANLHNVVFLNTILAGSAFL